MQDFEKSQEVFGQVAGKAMEMFTLWADANQRVLRELAGLSAATTKEAANLGAELGTRAVEALRESQVWWLRRQSEMRDAPKDPLAWYQAGVLESIEGTQKSLRFMEGGAQAVSRSVERLASTAARTSNDIQETFAALAAKMREIHAAA